MSARCTFCHGEPHTLGECPACGDRETMEKEIQRLNTLVRELRAERDDLLLQTEQLRQTITCCSYDSARANPGK